MAYDSNNIFAKILRGEIPCVKVYEDAKTLAFMDVMPESEGHVLVIPKEAAENLLDLSADGMAAMMATTQKVAKAVDKAIRDAGLGLNPQMDGQLLRIPLPELNQERRKELSKLAAKYAEAARIAVRNVRRDGMELLKKLEKDHKISEDEGKRQSEQVQKATDQVIADIDRMLAVKEKEILTV